MELAGGAAPDGAGGPRATSWPVDRRTRTRPVELAGGAAPDGHGQADKINGRWKTTRKTARKDQDQDQARVG
ncbi:MAG: hypothetical protein WC551_08200 [Patescibacteria group bacterium]